MITKIVYIGLALKYYQVMNYQFRRCNPITKVTHKALVIPCVNAKDTICSSASATLLRGV